MLARLLEAFIPLSWPARLWWLLTVSAAVASVPWCLSVEQPQPPLYVPLAAALFNALLVLITAHRRRRSSVAPTFDYGGVASVAVLVLAGPTAALVAHLGEKLTTGLVRNSAGHRPTWIRTAYNIAYGPLSLGAGWAVCLLLTDPVWASLAAGATWWLVNGLLVGPMAALSQRRNWFDGVRAALTDQSWLRAQEAVLILFVVLAWRAHPFLLGAVFLLILGQARTGQRLLGEHEAARLDPLTQLPNRNALAEVIAQPPLRPAVLMIDLDHFKRINDDYGHDAGDIVLVEVGQAIRHALRPGDFCARLGGEEFCAVLSDVDGDEHLVSIAERVREAIGEVRPSLYPLLHVTASVGGLCVPARMPLTDALRYADQATYRAKSDGRDRIELYVDTDLAA